MDEVIDFREVCHDPLAVILEDDSEPLVELVWLAVEVNKVFQLIEADGASLVLAMQAVLDADWTYVALLSAFQIQTESRYHTIMSCTIAIESAKYVFQINIHRMNQSQLPVDELQDLGPLEKVREDQELENQERSVQAAIDIFERKSTDSKFTEFSEQSLFEELQKCTHLDSSLKEQIQYSYLQLENLIALSQELLLLFGDLEIFASRASQLTHLCRIAQLQLSQVVYNLRHSYRDILGTYMLHKLNLPMTHQALKILSEQFLPKLKTAAENFFIKQNKQSPRILLIQFRFRLAQFHTIIETFPHAAAIPEDSILCKPKSHPDWQPLLQRTETRVLGTREQLLHSYGLVLQALESAQAMFVRKSEFKQKFLRAVIHNLGSAYYLLSKNERHNKAQFLQAEPNVELAFAVWNMGEKGLMSKLLPVMFKSIAYKQNIYIQRYFKSIDLDYIRNSELHKGIQASDQQFILGQPKLVSFQQLRVKEEGKKVQVRVLSRRSFENETQYQYYVDPMVKIRKRSIIEKLFSSKPETYFDKLIIHIHGGGFVAMSSRSHQNYTRVWANAVDAPIFSIDYRLSPKHSFPAALDDCWQAYLWIVHFSIHYFNVIPRKIVLVGDSAGGNLCAALTILCIRENVRVPDGLLLAYPALDLDKKNFAPSQYVALEDPLLPHTFLKLCQDSYLQGDLDGQNPLASPVYAPDEILQHFPKTYLMTGDNDPLHDDTWRFLQRLMQAHFKHSQNNRPCRQFYYPNMPHGMLSFDPLMPQCGVCVQHAIEMLKELLV